jgi:peroxisomal membrane protein 4
MRRNVLYLVPVNGPFPGETKLLLATHIPSPPGHPEHSHHALLAGAIGGYFVWGRYSSVNYQIVLYLTSRILVGLWKRHAAADRMNLIPAALRRRSYPIAAAIVWGVVMLLFEESPDVLHPSLKQSMEEIYRYQQG